MGLSFGIHDYIEGGVITAVILLNICVGFYQDYRAEKTIRSLQQLAAPESSVLRDGEIVKVKAESLVPGDIVHLTVGDIVPADLRLITGVNVASDEALLTGESLPVMKTPGMTFENEDLPVADRTNIAYSASKMTSGRAIGIVVATGMATEIGRIATMLRGDDNKPQSSNRSKRILVSVWGGVKNTLGLTGTPLQVTLSKFALLLFGLAILLAIIVFSANVWHIGGEVLIYGICVAVAVIPESLIAVLTITIAVGAKAMASGNVVTRNLSAMEAIGGVTNICSDKTGTLTQGRMIVSKAWIGGSGVLTVHDAASPHDPTSGFVQLDDRRIDAEEFTPDPKTESFLRTLSLCNTSTLHRSFKEEEVTGSAQDVTSVDEPVPSIGRQQSARTSTTGEEIIMGSPKWIGHGEPTEVALHVLAYRFNMGRTALLNTLGLQHAAEFPFDSSIKRMTVVYRSAQTGRLEAFSKGATEVLLPLCNVSEAEKKAILETAETLAGDGLRVLCIAHRHLTSNVSLTNRNTIEQGLEYLGLVGLHDPPRLESHGAVRACQMAGITVHMLTGDHPGTAMAIARNVGILQSIALNADFGKAVMIASDFDRLSDDEIDAMGNLPLVLARCSPATKVKMVEAMHRRGAFCVMTGDGVNDSPALKHADVGVAMGSGSAVARDASEMVLLDDNFASIVRAVKEGRRLFDNIQKFLMHLLISNIAQVILLLIGLAFKDHSGNSIFPLSPIEILWVNLITSSFLAIGLGLEEAQQDIMFRPPNSLKTGVFTRELIVDKFIYGFFMGSLCLGSFAVVTYVGRGSSGLGAGCNEGYNKSCAIVFRARSTTYATITLLLLVTAWEVKHFSRSLFNLYPSPSNTRRTRALSIFYTLWQNRFLFWAVVAGFTIMFPIIYIPVINREVFKHGAITWEWGVSFGCTAVYVCAIESWKAMKRRFGIGSGKIAVLSSGDAEMRAGLEPERKD
ncbi:sodium transport ATPase 5 [Delitschia confertaspora ATCC 74209]|uniref:Sodium transport ATPase 5 n=1 Tax=Delitschia confertaspora ATCC 74209 TaxID=1513339 RepID=A0A9P4JR98_9PLEO|nr:sodium transport ATPase 5 [Delitschia confertaspora ATCC 74209]